MNAKILDAGQVASYFISRSSELNESNDLTNLKLQKMLYYAQAEHYTKTGQVLFKEDIEAWDYGPVVPSVYRWLKGCGAYPITAFDIETDYSAVAPDQEAELSGIWDEYSKYSAGFLVKKTHDSKGPWYTAFHRNDKTISNDELSQVKLASEW